MQVTDKLTKALTEAKYLNADNVSRYRCIMRIFFENYEKLRYWLYQEEVYAQMVQDPFFADYKPEQCQQDLTMLVEWKNLNTIQDTKKVSSIEEFKNKKNDFVTVTVYAGNKYGILASDIAKMIEDGINPIVPLDIGGAIAMKRLFSTAILFCRSSREKMISNILEKSISNQEKMYRLLSLENEIDNEELCDFSIRTDNMEEAIEQVRMLLSIEKIDRK